METTLPYPGDLLGKSISLSWDNQAGYLEAEVLILWNPNCLREQDFRARLVVKLLTA